MIKKSVMLKNTSRKFISTLILFFIVISSAYSDGAFSHYIQGEDYLADSDYDNAIISFQRAIEMDDELIHAYAGLAKAYSSKYEATKDEKWYHLTLETAEKAIAVDPYIYYLPEVGLALAKAYSVRGEHNLAEDEYSILYELYPEYKELYPDTVKTSSSSSKTYILITGVFLSLIIGFFLFKKLVKSKKSEGKK